MASPGRSASLGEFDCKRLCRSKTRTNSATVFNTMTIRVTAAIIIWLASVALNPTTSLSAPIVDAEVAKKPTIEGGPAAETLPLDVAKRLQELRSGYDRYVEETISSPYDESVAILVASYRKALGLALAEATKKGDLDIVVAAKSELDRLINNQALPPQRRRHACRVSSASRHLSRRV